MRADRVGVVMVGSLLCIAACTPKKAQDNVEASSASDGGTDPAKICAKIEALGGPASPRERDLCLAQFASLGPNVRACFDPCIMQAANKADYEVCKDECTSEGGLARTICERGFNRLTEQPRIADCAARFTRLLSADRPKALCVAKCMRPATDNKLDTCSTQCGAPTL